MERQQGSKRMGVKRRRPWSPSVVAIAALLCGGGVQVPVVQADQASLVPEETDVTPTPTPIVSPAPTPFFPGNTSPTGTSAPSILPGPLSGPSASPTTILLSPTETSTSTSTPTAPIATILKEAFPLTLELTLNATESADLSQLALDIDGLLEDYLLSNLQSLTDDSLSIRDVSLEAFLNSRRWLSITPPISSTSANHHNHYRYRYRYRYLRALQALGQEVDLRVTGTVLYDLDANGCVDCVDEAIDAQLSDLLTTQALNTLVQNAEIDGVFAINGVLAASQIDYEGVADDDNSTDTSPLESNKHQSLERPSTLHIVLGFALTAVAVLTLLFYAYLFCRSRQRKQRKKKLQQQQQQQAIEFRPPPIATKPLPPVDPTNATAGDEDDDENIDNDSDGSSFKGVDSVSEGGAADSFARELQEAATLDQRAWDDFQRRKTDLDSMHNTNVVAKSEAESSDPGAWSKSFPYGDEPPPEQGIEMAAGAKSSSGEWDSYQVNVSPEEKKEEWSTDRNNRDPEPVTQETSSILQSIERTLMQYGGRRMVDDSLAPDEAVDEVARLSKYVQKYEKRKERRVQREHELSQHKRSPMSSAASTPTSQHHDPYGVRGSFLQRSTPPVPVKTPEQLLHTSPPQKNTSATVNPTIQPAQPKPAFRGITMTGAVYDDVPNDNDRGFSGSDDDSTYRDDEGSLLSQRLGISPFSVQRPEGSFDRSISPIQSSPFATPTVERLRDFNDGGYQSRAKLKDLRTNTAIVDESRSEVNIGYYPNPGTASAAAPVTPTMAAAPKPAPMSAPAPAPESKSTPSPAPAPSPASVPATKTTPQKTPIKTPIKTPTKASKNPKFNNLRNLFEAKPKNAIFPQDEHWQTTGSGKKK